jgi:antitoxin component YwqK of YwqJK toxin-antitoxin module
MRIHFIFIAIILVGCCDRKYSPDDLFSIQILDRNGLCETISVKERLSIYEKVDFDTPQPYQKVVRVYGKAGFGKTSSKILTYHPNGQPMQYLEIQDGRAFGQYRQWYENGQKKLEATVIAGTPDVSETAQMTWLFDGMSCVYDEGGGVLAEILYEKGFLHGFSRYYHSGGAIAKEVFYQKDEIEGVVRIFDRQGECVEEISYTKGVKNGEAAGYWFLGSPKYKEIYENGSLIFGQYYTYGGEKVGGVENGEGEIVVFNDNKRVVIQCHLGVVEGVIKTFNSQGGVISSVFMKGNKKNGEELEYYPSLVSEERKKLSMQWKDDRIEGVVKTWYESGALESEREFHDNKKHGRCFAWFPDGELMLMEEYENDCLIKGLYFKKSEKEPISKVLNGVGVATISDSFGSVVKKIVYEKGIPECDQ